MRPLRGLSSLPNLPSRPDQLSQCSYPAAPFLLRTLRMLDGNHCQSLPPGRRVKSRRGRNRTSQHNPCSPSSTSVPLVRVVVYRLDAVCICITVVVSHYSRV